MGHCNSRTLKQLVDNKPIGIMFAQNLKSVECDLYSLSERKKLHAHVPIDHVTRSGCRVVWRSQFVMRKFGICQHLELDQIISLKTTSEKTPWTEGMAPITQAALEATVAPPIRKRAHQCRLPRSGQHWSLKPSVYDGAFDCAEYVLIILVSFASGLSH